MPNTPGSRVVLKRGERLQDVVPAPSGPREDVRLFLLEAGFSHDVVTRGRQPAAEPEHDSSVRIVLSSGFDMLDGDGTVVPILDSFVRVSSEPLDRCELQSLHDSLTLFGQPMVAALQHFQGDHVVRAEYVAESLLATR